MERSRRDNFPDVLVHRSWVGRVQMAVRDIPSLDLARKLVLVVQMVRRTLVMYNMVERNRKVLESSLVAVVVVRNL